MAINGEGASSISMTSFVEMIEKLGKCSLLGGLYELIRRNKREGKTGSNSRL